jgi:membrane protein DedA with SNARE-associated domain
LIGLLGYFFGHSYEFLHKLLGIGGMVLLAGFAAVAGVIIFVRHWRSHAKGPDGGDRTAP